MPRLDAAPITLSQSGVYPAAVAAQADGHMIANNGDVFVEVVNASTTTARTVTFPTPAEREGLAIADRVVSIPAASRRLIGPFQPSLFNQQAGANVGKMYVDYVAGEIADITIRAFKFPAL